MALERAVEERMTVRGAADGFVQEITAGRHQLRSDYPVSRRLSTVMISRRRRTANLKGRSR